MAKLHEWIELSPGRKIDPNKGYVRLNKTAIAADEMWLYDAMRGATTFVSEHRMVMARHLGRPLTSKELVDHMDGDKINNDPSNLRLYRRGRNDPGDTNGYGTYYHEWQMAEARVRELEHRLATTATS
jgi:HNH endonuclease